MKTILLGNDTKDQVERRIKDKLASLGIDMDKDDFAIHVINDEEGRKISFELNNGNVHEFSYDDVLDGLEEEVADLRDEKRMQVVSSAGMLSRADGKVSEVYGKRKKYESNVKVASNIIGYGHKTISEHDYLVFGLEDVSPIVEQTLIGYRLTSFTIKSRRNVDFRNVGFYVPEFKDKDGNELKDNKKLKSVYTKYMQSLFNKYGDFVDMGLPVEDCRFVLPYCYHSNIIMGCDCNQFLRMTSDFLYGKLANISEIHELGLQFEQIIKEHIPYLVPALENEKKKKYYEDRYQFVDELMDKSENVSEIDIEHIGELETDRGQLLDGVRLTNYTPNADLEVLCSFLMARYQLSHKDALIYLNRMSYFCPDVKREIMQAIIKSKNQRELEQVNFCFEIPIDLATLTHLTRHRMHSLLVPDFVPMWDLGNYITPESIAKEHKDEYDEIFTNNKLMMEEFKKHGVRDEDLIYFYLSGNMGNVYTNINGRSLEWISRMRCCNKAQWPIRNIANQMVDEVSKVAPLIGEGLGPTCKVEGYCPEGKDSCKNRGVVILAKK